MPRNIEREIGRGAILLRSLQAHPEDFCSLLGDWFKYVETCSKMESLYKNRKQYEIKTFANRSCELGIEKRTYMQHIVQYVQGHFSQETRSIARRNYILDHLFKAGSWERDVLKD